MTSTSAILERLYEAAVIPELWGRVCDDLANVSNSKTAALITVDASSSFRFVSNPGARETVANYIAGDEKWTNVRPKRALALDPWRFTRDTDLMTQDEVDADPVFQKYIIPAGLRWTCGYATLEPSGYTLIFDFMKSQATAPYSDDDIVRLNALKPDLSRAAFLGARFAFRQAQSITQAFSMIGLPSLVLGDGGGVIAANKEMEALAPRVSTGRGNRLRVKNPGPQLLLEKAIARLRTNAEPSVYSIPIAADEGGPPVVLQIIPVKRMARDIFSRSMAVVIATTVGQVGTPDVRVLCGLFDLTPAEARVAREIATGMSTKEIASRLGLTRETVRFYIKQILSKTGTRRQSQLASLLSGALPA